MLCVKLNCANVGVASFFFKVQVEPYHIKNPLVVYVLFNLVKWCTEELVYQLASWRNQPEVPSACGLGVAVVWICSEDGLWSLLMPLTAFLLRSCFLLAWIMPRVCLMVIDENKDSVIKHVNLFCTLFVFACPLCQFSLLKIIVFTFEVI